MFGHSLCSLSSLPSDSPPSAPSPPHPSPPRSPPPPRPPGSPSSLDSLPPPSSLEPDASVEARPKSKRVVSNLNGFLCVSEAGASAAAAMSHDQSPASFDSPSKKQKSPPGKDSQIARGGDDSEEEDDERGGSCKKKTKRIEEKLLCPAQGCELRQFSGEPAFASHIDQHTTGRLLVKLPMGWLSSVGRQVCSKCNLSISALLIVPRDS